MMVSIFVLMGVTVLISYKGIKDGLFFNKNEFHIGSIQSGEKFRMFSSGFLHVDFQHLFFNMFTLYLFAPYVVYNLSTSYFLILYLGSLLSGSLLTLYFHKNENHYRRACISSIIKPMIKLINYLNLI
jgi:membrane associated rhomboid family serine protease